MKIKFLISKKAFKLSLLFGLIFSVFVSLARFDAACESLRTNVLRLHIIANSDSSPDQEIKLKIRDRILESSDDMFEDSGGLDEALLIAEASLDSFKETANEVLRENGFFYNAEVKIGESYFETRVYDDFTLPAGNYKSLIITLGEGEGENWWCVIYPEVCLPAAANEASLSDTANEVGVRIAENSEEYIIRFKAVEIYENIKNFFKR